MQAARRLPRAVAHAGDELARRAGRMQGNRAAVAGDEMPRFGHAGHLDLQPLDRRVHISHGAAGARFLAEHVPRFERLPQFDMDAAPRDRTVHREPELQVRREPLRLHRIPAPPEIGEDVAEIVGHEVRQHEAIVELRVPANQRLIVGGLPEAGNERAQQELLRQAHLRVRRHLERAQLDESLPAAARFRRVELVDAELGAVRVAGQIDQQMPEHAIDQPRRRLAAARAPARTRSRARGANRSGPRRRADAGSSGRRRAPRRGTTATGDCASSRAGCAADRAAAGTGLSAGVAPPSTMWLPPPVPVCRPSSMNFSVPSRL